MQTPLVGHGSNPVAPPALVPPVVACPPVACPPVAEAPPEAPPAAPAVPPLDVPAVFAAPPVFELPPKLELPALPALPPAGAAPPGFEPPGLALPPFAVVPPIAVVPPVATLPPLELPACDVEPPLPAFESVGDEEHATKRASSGKQAVGRHTRFMTIFNGGTSDSIAGSVHFLSPPSTMFRSSRGPVHLRWLWRIAGSLMARATLLLFLLLLTRCAGQAGVPGNMQQWNRPFPPYRVIDDIYYVGSNEIAQFLITTPAGHILLDTGFEASVPRLRENIESLGFRYGDIKLILTSHAHIDHVQAHALVRQQTGAQVVASTADAAFIENGGKGETVYDGVFEWARCPVDRRVADGEPVTLGGVTLTARLTPGHTLGATTWTMQVHDQGKSLAVVFFPSANINPGVHLIDNPRYPQIARDFASSFAVWKGLPCDVFLADHGEFYGMKAKYRQLQSGASTNPFIDPDGYRGFIAESERRFRERLASER